MKQDFRKSGNKMIAWFEEIGKEDVSLAGGKGASLGEMLNAGIPVPPGFVVLSAAFEQFLKETELNVEVDAALDSVNHKEVHTVEDASERIKALVMAEDIPKDIAKEIVKSFKKLGSRFVAVRSSATSEDSSTAAWAGQLESYLNTTEKTLLENIKLCWASLFTPRAIFYRFEKGLHNTKISVAVVVQKMVESNESGVAFSVHPVTQDRNQLVIEAGFGLGEAVVSGSITPDTYVVLKASHEIIEKSVSFQSKALYRSANSGNEWKELPREVGERQVLPDSDILRLAKLVIRIESHYSFPVDVEWARERGKFYITQSRPITTLIDISENNKQNVLYARDWKHYLTRPFSLFGASLWHKWYDSDALEECIGMRIKDVLMIEEKPRIVAHYVPQKQLEEFSKKTYMLVQDNKKLKRILKKAFELNKKAKALLEGKERFNSLQDGINFVTQLGIYAAQTPRAVLNISKEVRNKKLIFVAEQLRAISYYPRIIEKVLTPFAQKELGLSKDDINNSSITQLLSGSVGKTKEGHFIYSIVNGKENVAWEKDINKVLSILHPEINDKVEKLKGMSVFPGKVSGIARIIDTLNYIMAPFNDGDILVSINSNPTYAPLIRKAAALVTDEGGLGTHAAIIAREMKKPGVVGTKIATKVIKDGDKIEVDADRGVVRILKRS